MANTSIGSGVTQTDFNIYAGDTLQVVSGGVASFVNIFSGGTAYVSAGGSGAYFTLLSGGTLYLGPKGGQLERTTVASGGTFFMNGGNASQTSLVETSARMFLNEGTANSVTVAGSKCRLEMSGGILSSATVGKSNATSNLSALIKVSGGNILNTEVRSGGTVWMTGGAASSAYIGEGGLWSMGGGRMSSATVAKGGSVLMNNASANSVFVSGDYLNSSGGTMTVINGGILTCASAHYYGTVKVNSGGSASNVSLNLGGTLEVNGGRVEKVSATGFGQGFINVSGGTVTDILFSNTFNGHNGAALNVYTGGSADTGKIIEQANVYYGGKVSELNIYSAGVLTLYGGTATSTNVMISGHLNVSGGLALNTELSPLVNGIVDNFYDIYGKPAYMDVFADGSALNTVVSKGGSLTVQGTATNTTVSSGGFATVLSTGIASNFIVEWGAEGDVWSGARVSGGTVSGGRLEVTAGGTAENVVVRGGNGSVGKLIVGSGGFVSGTTAGPAGSMYLFDGAAAANILASNGTIHVSNGGWLSHTELDNGGILHVSSGGLALNTVVHENGRLIVEEGGVMSSATVEAGGSCLVSSGGRVDSLTVEFGGTALLSSGSIIAGPLVLNGGRVTFDLSQLAGPDDKPLVTNFDKITGTPDYQAVVGPEQAPGTYLLADSAAGFAGTITVTGTSYGDLGVIADGQSLKYENQYYRLSLDGSDLLMTVSAPSDVFLTIAGEFATNGIGDELAMFADGSIRLQNLSNPTGSIVGTLDPVRWELVGTLDFDGDGLEELAFKDIMTGNVFLADDPASGISAEKLLSGTCLGLLGQGYSFYGAGSFDGKPGQNDILMKGPAFGDPTLSLNYGLPVWVYNDGVKQYNGWLGALVNTWQTGDPLKGDISDPADINAKNYQYDIVGIGDFNGDGRSDVMLQNTMPSSVAGKAITGAGDIFVFLTGDEAAVQAGAAPTVCYTGKVDAVNLNGWCVAGIGDFNNDGIDDVLLLDQASRGLAAWVMGWGQMQYSAWFGTMSDDQEIAGIWDVDDDGTDDVVLAGATRHEAWIIKSAQHVSTQQLA